MSCSFNASQENVIVKTSCTFFGRLDLRKHVTTASDQKLRIKFKNIEYSFSMTKLLNALDVNID